MRLPGKQAGEWVALTLIVATVVVPAISGFWLPSNTQDEAILLVYADQILAGRLPHRDFFTVYGPGAFAVVSGAFKILGASVEAERLVGLLYHLAISVGVLRLTRPMGMVRSFAASVASAIVLLPLGLVAFAWLGALSGLVWALVLLQRPPTSTTVGLAGVLAGAVTLWRPEMLLVSSVAAAPFVLRSGRAGPFLTGLAGGLLPVAAYIALFGRELVVNVLFGRIGIDGGVDLGQAPPIIFVGLALLAAATTVLIAAAIRVRTRAALAFALMAVALLPQGFQRPDAWHLCFVLCVSGPLAIAMSGKAFARRRGTSRKRVFPTGSVLAAVSVVIVGLSVVMGVGSASLAMARPTHRVEFGGRSLIVANEAEAKALRLTLASLNGARGPGGTVFVGAQDMGRPTVSYVHIYHLLPADSAGAYFLELPPGVAERPGSRLVEDIKVADILLLTDVPTSLVDNLFPHIGRGSDDANRMVDAEFCRVADTNHGVIYKHCRPR